MASGSSYGARSTWRSSTTRAPISACPGLSAVGLAIPPHFDSLSACKIPQVADCALPYALKGQGIQRRRRRRRTSNLRPEINGAGSSFAQAGSVAVAPHMCASRS